MTQLPEFSDTATFRDLLEPAMEIARQGDRQAATEYVAAYKQYLLGRGASEARADYVIAQNVGYYAGYYGSDVQDAVFEVFGYAHPMFGRTQPTPQEAFDAGKKAAEEGLYHQLNSL